MCLVLAVGLGAVDTRMFGATRAADSMLHVGPRMTGARVLAGDIGGTKTWLAVAEVSSSGELRELHRARYESRAYPSLSHVIDRFAEDAPGALAGVATVAFGVAGPVRDARCTITNLPWIIDAAELEERLGARRVTLLNDFQAVAHGVPALPFAELHTLQDAPLDPNGPIAVLGAGTGLGEAIAISSDRERIVLATEGGHADFAPRNDLEVDLWRDLRAMHHHVSYERLLSGAGLVAIYEFLIKSGRAVEGSALREGGANEDLAATIGRHATEGDAASLAAVRLFSSIYGAEAGNLALKCLPTGGVFVAGGIAPQILSVLAEGGFMSAFLDKGRMAPLLTQMRVAVVLDPTVGLLGALCRARDLVRCE